MIDCFECGSPAEENHHVVPKSRGGKRTIPLCCKCHGLVHGTKRVSTSELTKLGLQRARERGIFNGRPAKLTDEQRLEAIKMVEEMKKTGKEVAEYFNVHPATISRLVNGKTPNRKFKREPSSVVDQSDPHNI